MSKTIISRALHKLVDDIVIQRKFNGAIGYFKDQAIQWHNLKEQLKLGHNHGIGRSLGNIQQELVNTGLSADLLATQQSIPAEQVIQNLDQLYHWYLNGNPNKNISQNYGKAAIWLAIKAIHPALDREQRAQATRELGLHYRDKLNNYVRGVEFLCIAYKNAENAREIEEQRGELRLKEQDEFKQEIIDTYRYLCSPQSKHYKHFRQQAQDWLVKQGTRITSNDLFSEFYVELLGLAKDAKSQEDYLLGVLQHATNVIKKSHQNNSTPQKYNACASYYQQQNIDHPEYNPKVASLWLSIAKNPNEPKSIFKLARLYHVGTENLKKNIAVAGNLYKLIEFDGKPRFQGKVQVQLQQAQASLGYNINLQNVGYPQRENRLLLILETAIGSQPQAFIHEDFEDKVKIYIKYYQKKQVPNEEYNPELALLWLRLATDPNNYPLIFEIAERYEHGYENLQQQSGIATQLYEAVENGTDAEFSMKAKCRIAYIKRKSNDINGSITRFIELVMADSEIEDRHVNISKFALNKLATRYPKHDAANPQERGIMQSHWSNFLDAEAQGFFDIAFAYYTGKTTPDDRTSVPDSFQKAAIIYQSIADKKQDGADGASFFLAMIYLQGGRGIEKDVIKALGYFEDCLLHNTRGRSYCQVLAARILASFYEPQDTKVKIPDISGFIQGAGEVVIDVESLRRSRSPQVLVDSSASSSEGSEDEQVQPALAEVHQFFSDDERRGAVSSKKERFILALMYNYMKDPRTNNTPSYVFFSEKVDYLWEKLRGHQLSAMEGEHFQAALRTMAQLFYNEDKTILALAIDGCAKSKSIKTNYKDEFRNLIAALKGEHLNKDSEAIKALMELGKIINLLNSAAQTIQQNSLPYDDSKSPFAQLQLEYQQVSPDGIDDDLANIKVYTNDRRQALAKHLADHHPAIDGLKTPPAEVFLALEETVRLDRQQDLLKEQGVEDVSELNASLLKTLVRQQKKEQYGALIGQRDFLEALIENKVEEKKAWPCQFNGGTELIAKQRQDIKALLRDDFRELQDLKREKPIGDVVVADEDDKKDEPLLSKKSPPLIKRKKQSSDSNSERSPSSASDSEDDSRKPLTKGRKRRSTLFSDLPVSEDDMPRRTVDHKKDWLLKELALLNNQRKVIIDKVRAQQREQVEFLQKAHEQEINEAFLKFRAQYDRKEKLLLGHRPPPRLRSPDSSEDSDDGTSFAVADGLDNPAESSGSSSESPYQPMPTTQKDLLTMSASLPPKRKPSVQSGKGESSNYVPIPKFKKADPKSSQANQYIQLPKRREDQPTASLLESQIEIPSESDSNSDVEEGQYHNRPMASSRRAPQQIQYQNRKLSSEKSPLLQQTRSRAASFDIEAQRQEQIKRNWDAFAVSMDDPAQPYRINSEKLQALIAWCEKKSPLNNPTKAQQVLEQFYYRQPDTNALNQPIYELPDVYVFVRKPWLNNKYQGFATKLTPKFLELARDLISDPHWMQRWLMEHRKGIMGSMLSVVSAIGGGLAIATNALVPDGNTALQSFTQENAAQVNSNVFDWTGNLGFASLLGNHTENQNMLLNNTQALGDTVAGFADFNKYLAVLVSGLSVPVMTYLTKKFGDFLTDTPQVFALPADNVDGNDVHIFGRKFLLKDDLQALQDLGRLDESKRYSALGPLAKFFKPVADPQLKPPAPREPQPKDEPKPEKEVKKYSGRRFYPKPGYMDELSMLLSINRMRDTETGGMGERHGMIAENLAEYDVEPKRVGWIKPKGPFTS